MGRAPRIHFKGAIFHVMSRGNGGQDIFLDDSQRQRFLSILSQVKRENVFKIFAYCLMPNHFHFLIQVADRSLSRGMQQLLTRYSKHFNMRQNRKGHLFQSRYKAILCRDDAYFLELLRYVHLNPVRKKLVATASAWHWSGHGELNGEKEAALVDVGFPLSLFDADKMRAREKYSEFILTAKDMPPLGSPTLGQLELLTHAISEETEIGIDAIRGGIKTPAVVKARHALIRRAVEAGFRQRQLAEFLGCSSPAISKAMRPAAEQVNINV
jgi:REP element-mobilizing transposase RayT